MPTLKKSFLFIFTSILFLGFFLSFTSIKFGELKGENRRLASFPKLALNKKELLDFPKGFETYINDNFVLRPLLVRIFSSLSYQLGKSPNKRILIGKENWLFNDFNQSINQFRGLHHSNIKKFINHLQITNNYLREKKIPFLFYIAPNKVSIYPEFLPNHLTAVKNASKRDYGQLFSQLKQTNIWHLDLKQELLKKKGGNIIYAPYGTHWNKLGGYYAYHSIIKEVQSTLNLPQLKFLEEEEISFSTCDGETTLLQQLNLFSFNPEPINLCSKIKNPSKTKSQLLTKNALGQEATEVIRNNDKNELTILLIGDSFTNTLKGYFKESFGISIRTFHHFDDKWDKTLIDTYQPDIVIYEMVERYITKF